MEAEKTICALCAWRETCQKKFSVSGRDMRCTDFVRDLRIKKEETSGEREGETKKE
jgi:hypothetical protein